MSLMILSPYAVEPPTLPPATGSGLLTAGGTVSTLSAITEVYDHGTAVVSIGTSLGTARGHGTGTGTGTYGYVFGGHNGSTALNVVDKFQWSTGSVSPGSPKITSRWRTRSCGNSTLAKILGGGLPEAFADDEEYTYATETAVVGVATSNNFRKKYFFAMGNPTHGYFGGGSDSASPDTIYDLNYSNNTSSVVGTVLNSGQYPPSGTPSPEAASNAVDGIYMWHGGSYYAERFHFADHTSTNITFSTSRTVSGNEGLAFPDEALFRYRSYDANRIHAISFATFAASHKVVLGTMKADTNLQYSMAASSNHGGL